MKRRAAPALVLLLVLAGCGGGSSHLTVFAATSLKTAFERYDPSARFSFAGSDELAAQIRQGSEPDVYAAANTKLPAALFAQKLVGKPTVFAANRLVLAVPAGSAKVKSVNDLAKRGVKIAIGSAGVPVGSYTRQVVARLGPTEAKALFRNVRSEEPDVGGIVGKLTQGAVDAGFVYVTDVRATKGALRAVELPARLEPAVRYGIAVVRGTIHARAARAFVRGLLAGKGRTTLTQAGFR
ncbi:MAG: molybdate ABC transporter substrate-binding protein [Thermoleophilaceae bacterium]